MDYENGWVGLTKTIWKEMHNVISNELPFWARVSSGSGLKARETLRANGIDPNAVPIVMKSEYSTIGKILEEINETIPITYVDIPE